MDSLPKTIEEAIACGLIQKSKPAPPNEEYEEVIAYEREERDRMGRYLLKLCEAAGVTPKDRETPLGYTARARSAILDLKAND